MSTIQVKRGIKDNLPTNAAPGEPLVTLDTKELFVGDINNIVSPVQIVSDNIIDKGDPNGIAELDSAGNVPRYIKTSDLYFGSMGITTINYNQNKLLVSLPLTEYRVFKFLINVADQTTSEFYSSEIMAHHNGVQASFTEYAVIGTETVSFSVEVVDSNINLYGLSTKNSQVVRVITTAIRFT